MAAVLETHVDRQGRIRRSGRQLEATVPTIRLREPKDEFLCCEMAGVARPRIHDVTTEGDRKRPIHRNADSNPRCNRRALPVASLEVTDLRLAETDPSPELRLRESSSLSSRPSVASQRGGDRLRFSSSRDLCCGSLPSGHIDTIVTDGSAPAIGGRSTRNCGISISRRESATHSRAREDAILARSIAPPPCSSQGISMVSILAGPARALERGRAAGAPGRQPCRRPTARRRLPARTTSH
jgi:hypothetical protein